MDSCAVCATFRHKRFFHAKEARVNGCIESEWLPRVKDKRHACHWCCLSSPSKRTLISPFGFRLRANLKFSPSHKKMSAAAEREAQLIPWRSPRLEARCLAPEPAPRRRRRNGHNGSRE